MSGQALEKLRNDNGRFIQRELDLTSDFDLGWIIGMVLGDGFIYASKSGNYIIGLRSTRRDYVHFFADVVESRFPMLKPLITNKTQTRRFPNGTVSTDEMFSVVFNSKALYSLLRPHKLPDYYWTIPSEIIRSNESTKGFLQGIFDAEGCVSRTGLGSFCISISSKHDANLIQLKPLLRSFSIRTKLYRHRLGHYFLYIHKNYGGLTFMREIGFRYPPKQQKLKQMCNYAYNLRQYTKDEYNNAMELHRKGCSYAAISRKLGIGQSTLHSWGAGGQKPWRIRGDNQ